MASANMATSASLQPIRVLIVDDSSAMRLLLSEIINRQPDMRVIATAPETATARQLIRELQPDVVTLDVEMPGMDGISFLERLMRLNPLPVLMISSAGDADSDLALHALDLGAMDFISKRQLKGRADLNHMAIEITQKIRHAAEAGHHFKRVEPTLSSARPTVDPKRKFPSNHIICLGASTGGTEAIKRFVMGLPINTPPVLIVQHMPEGFTQRFATRLNNECEVHIKEAAAGDVIRPGCVYIAPGHAHILIERVAGGSYKIVLSDGPEVNRHRPSVDVLFNSAAKVLGKNATSVLLTGMGRDGAQGMAAMKAAGAYCFAQDEASSVVYGMPRAAFELGVVDEQGSPEHLAVRVLDRLVALAEAQGSKA